MNIREINEKLNEILEADNVEWVEEVICKITPQMNELLITDVDMYGCLSLSEAVDEMKEFYLEDKLNVVIPTTTEFTYKGTKYNLYLAMGNVVYSRNKLICRYGIKHILDKHSKEHAIIDNGSLCKESVLLNGIKNIETVIDKGKCFVDKDNTDRLVFVYNNLLYVICLSNKDTELTYLQTVFRPSKKFKQSHRQIKVANPIVQKATTQS